MSTALSLKKITTFGNDVFIGPFTGVGNDCTQRADNAFAAIKAEMEKTGLRSDEVVKCSVMLRDASEFHTVAESYKRNICQTLPAFGVIPCGGVPEGELAIELLGVKSGRPEMFFFKNEEIPAAVRCGNYIYTSTMFSTDTGSIELQAASALERMLDAVKMAGGTATNLVKNFVLLADCTDFGAFNQVYGSTFMSLPEPPARSLHGAENLPLGVKAALEGIAYLGSDKKMINLGEEGKKLPFCSGMRAGNRCYISGQIGLIAPDGGYNLSMQSQFEPMFDIIEEIANAAGFNRNEYAKVNAFIRTTEGLDAFGGAYTAAYGDGTAAVSCYCVSGLAHPAILVEMDAIAIKAARESI